jgi:glycosyltransferase involved in cell wall biosynthesis
MRRTIAVLSDIDPSGGGSHQWALNILYALDDYRAARGDLDVVVMHYHRYPGGHPLKPLFPAFAFAPVGGVGNLMSRILRRLTVAAPWMLPLLRLFSPLNVLAARHHAETVLFPVTGLDSLLCNRRNIFCMADIAHVYFPHFPELREGNGLKVRDVLFRYGLANADRVMVESEELRREIARHYGADPAKAHVVYQVLPRLFETSAHPDIGEAMPRPYLFYPAQLWTHKNHQNLLTAFSELAKEFPDLHLVLSGSRKAGDEAIFARIAALGLTGRVRYLGYVPDEKMPQLYRNAAALVMPTWFGPSNIPTLEAFAFGTPAVISDLPGVEEQVLDAALRFDPADPADMAAKLRRVLTDKALAAALVEKGRARLTQLSYDNFRQQMFALYDAALRR